MTINEDVYLASNGWPRICDKFFESLGMSNAPAHQFEIHDYMLKLSEAFTKFNRVDCNNKINKAS